MNAGCKPGAPGRALAGLITVLGLAAALAAQGARAETVQGSTWLQGAGSTFAAPLYQAWIEAWQGRHKGSSLTYEAIGSGAGINRFLADTVDFAGSDAPIKDEQIARIGRGVVSVPATAGMIVLAYSLPGGIDDLKLPRDVYAAIFAGDITRWNDPRIEAANPGVKLPDLGIAVVTRMDASGTTFAFTSHLNAISALWRERGLGVGTSVDWPGSAMQVKGNEGVAQRIKISSGAIGYVEYGFAKRLNLPVAALENRAGKFVRPSAEAGTAALSETADTMDERLRISIADAPGAGAYPIVTYSWLLLYGHYDDEIKASTLRDFVGWGLTAGQSMQRDDLSGYIPLPANVVAKGQQALATIR
ncbi:MAG: phosphate ABC transporter substrate-binding protein PstS [Rhodospirillales bacterium]|nr:phosphate ABC transporter substrate-binding protein PstS [Rhodospirillales bacterium]